MHEPPFGHALINLLMPGNTLFQPLPPPKALKRDPDAVLTVEEAAEYLRLEPKTLKGMCYREEITHSRVDYRNHRFRQADLDEFLMRRTLKAKAP
jgi:excisionase family DNA binding protein